MKRWYPFYPENVPSEIELPVISIYTLLEDSADKYPENLAVIDGDEKLTYAELKKAVDSFAVALFHRGFIKGERVVLMLPNCKEYIIAYYAVHRLTGIVVQSNPMYQTNELDYILRDSGAKWIISHRELQKKVRETGLANQITMIATDGTSEQIDSLYHWIEEERDQQLPPIDVQPKKDIAVLQYTGGTTGQPKGVMLTHFNLVSNLYQNFVSYAGVYEKSKECVLGIAPVFHAMGMTNMNMAIFTGSVYISMDKFEIKKLLHLIRKYKVTNFGGSPTMYIALLRHTDLQTGDLDSLKICSCGSAPMPVEVINEFEQRSGAHIIEAYGLSEATTAVTRNPMKGLRKVGSRNSTF